MPTGPSFRPCRSDVEAASRPRAGGRVKMRPESGRANFGVASSPVPKHYQSRAGPVGRCREQTTSSSVNELHNIRGVPDGETRARRNGHPGCVLWLTGLSASGKSTIASELHARLFDEGRQVYLLDGDIIRTGLCSDLKFSPQDRRENIRRVGEVAGLFADAGFICIAAFISPYRQDRALVRGMSHGRPFIEVFVNAPIEVCFQRDPKGLYAKARAGKIPDFTGVSAPYEAPETPEVEVRTDQLSVAACAEKILAHLRQAWVTHRPPA